MPLCAALIVNQYFSFHTKSIIRLIIKGEKEFARLLRVFLCTVSKTLNIF